MEEDDYYLKWEKHHNAFVSVFDYLYKHEILVDCSLAAEDKHIKAHRIVLMACSPYLQKILCEHSENYPIVFFDIKYPILEAIVNFCYRGEVKVAENKLEDFLEAATALQIKGLCRNSACDVINSDDNCDKNKRRLSLSDSNTIIDSGVANKKAKISNNESDNRLISDEVIEIASEDTEKIERNGYSSHPLAVVKSEPDDSLAREIQGSDDDNSDVDSDDSGDSGGPNGDHVDTINDLLTNSSTILFPWTCNRCGEAFPTRAPYEEHRRNCARSDPISHPWKCHKCANAYKNKKDLVRHLFYCGNDTPRLFCNRCGNSYKYERGLRRHQKYCGTDVKPLKCPQCEKTYKYKRGLRRHQRRCGIAEALQFLAGKGVTPVVVTKRSLGLPYLGEISRAGLPITAATHLAQLTIDKGIRKPDGTDSSSIQQHTLDPAVFNPALFSEPSVCQCGKVYKYKKSYDKHVATCSCNPNAKSKRGRRSKKNGHDDDDDNDEDEGENNEEEDEEEEEEEADGDKSHGGETKQNNHDTAKQEEDDAFILEISEDLDEEHFHEVNDEQEEEEVKCNNQKNIDQQKIIDLEEEEEDEEEIHEKEKDAADDKEETTTNGQKVIDLKDNGHKPEKIPEEIVIDDEEENDNDTEEKEDTKK